MDLNNFAVCAVEPPKVQAVNLVAGWEYEVEACYNCDRIILEELLGRKHQKKEKGKQ